MAIDLATGGYATVPDFDLWIAPDVAPNNAVRLLRSASLIVGLACFRSVYADDSPSAGDAPVLRDATCTQAASWAALGINPDQLGLTTASAPVKKSSILSADVERDTSAQAEAALCAARDLCPEARAILTATGLIYEPVPQFDTSGYLPHYGLSGPAPWWGAPLAEREFWPFA